MPMTAKPTRYESIPPVACVCRGAYPVQPVGKPPKNSALRITRYPAMKIQNEKASTRG